MRYDPEPSSINFYRSMIYGLGVLPTSMRYRLQHLGVAHSDLFDNSGAVHLRPVWESVG
jgi:hypothetical protein